MPFVPDDVHIHKGVQNLVDAGLLIVHDSKDPAKPNDVYYEWTKESGFAAFPSKSRQDENKIFGHLPAAFTAVSAVKIPGRTHDPLFRLAMCPTVQAKGKVVGANIKPDGCLTRLPEANISELSNNDIVVALEMKKRFTDGEVYKVKVVVESLFGRRNSLPLTESGTDCWMLQPGHERRRLS